MLTKQQNFCFYEILCLRVNRFLYFCNFTQSRTFCILFDREQYSYYRGKFIQMDSGFSPVCHLASLNQLQKTLTLDDQKCQPELATQGS